MHRLLITHPLPSAVSDHASAQGVELDVHNSETPMPHAQLAERLRDKHALVCTVNDRIDAELLGAAPQLRVVANCAVGFDNIDVDAATHAGVQVTNTPDVLTDATADLAMALILATARRIPEGDRHLRAGNYRHWKLHQEQLGLDVFGQTLGIFGLGRIGRAVAYRAQRGFDMTVLATSRTQPAASELPSLDVEFVDFDDLLARSDIISIHAPMTESTHHIFDAAAFERMTSSSILVNTARGALVDEAASHGRWTPAKSGGRDWTCSKPNRTSTPASYAITTGSCSSHTSAAQRNARVGAWPRSRWTTR